MPHLPDDLDLRGKTFLVTGATSGIGRATVERLAPLGPTLVLVGRNEALCKEVVASLTPHNPNVSYLLADLSRPDEVRDLAARFQASHDRLDVLLNNAGAYFQSRDVTPDGFERTFALDHLAYFVLTTELLDLLKASAPSRVVCTASDAHKGGHVHWDDLQLERSWGAMGFEAYAQAKLLNILFTRELARRLEGTGVTANCLHPGFVASTFAHNNGAVGTFVMRLLRPFQRTPRKSAEGVAYVAAAPELKDVSGMYFVDGRPVTPAKQARDDEAAARLWQVTEDLLTS